MPPPLVGEALAEDSFLIFSPVGSKTNICRKTKRHANRAFPFTSTGSGHGVGMSQYGADGMAKKGYGYKEILSHYYKGTEVY